MRQRGRKSAAQRAITSRPWQNSEDDQPPPAPVLPAPPPHLQPATQAWWIEVVATFAIQSHEYRTLEVAAVSWDVAETARAVVAAQGLSYTDSKGMIRSRPEVAIARDARVAFLRAMRELELGAVPPPIGGLGITHEQLHDWRKS
jgi:phage terminase small subunit